MLSSFASATSITKGSVWFKVVILCGLLWTLWGCGVKTPKSIVQQALSYEIAHPAASRQALVGADVLPSYSQIKSLQLKQEKRLSLRLADAAKVPGVHIQGTYTLSVAPPGDRRPYTRSQEPFQLTLAQISDTDPETAWVLAYSQPGAQPLWTTIAFLPTPKPTPLVTRIQASPTPMAEIPLLPLSASGSPS
jgi:hypothetical protein